MQREIEKRPVGGLDMTTNYQDVNPVDYVDAKNLTNNERDINSAVDLKGIKGIEKILDNLPDISGSLKSYRVFIDSTNDPTGIFTNFTQIIVSSSRGISLAPIVIAGGGSITAFINNLDIALTAVLAPYGLVPTVGSYIPTPTSSAYLGYFDISFNLFDDYSIEFEPYVPAGSNAGRSLFRTSREESPLTPSS